MPCRHMAAMAVNGLIFVTVTCQQNPAQFAHALKLFLFSHHYLLCLRNGYSKFQLNQVSS